MKKEVYLLYLNVKNAFFNQFQSLIKSKPQKIFEKFQIGHQPERKIGSLYEFVRFVRVRTLIKTDLRTVKSF